jgi:LacI family transcriptional regulator
MPPRKSGRPMVTVRDIAQEAGVSIGAVSIVLNDAPLARYMADATKRRIKEIARKLGYSPNQLARSLRGLRNHTVGLMVVDVTDPFCTPILRGIESSLFEASYMSVLADAHNQVSRFERYLEMMLERRVEGLIVVANWLVVDIDLLSDLERHRIPTVIIGRQLQSNSLSSVMVDNETGGRIAIEHLFSLGHRKIAFIRGPKVLGDSVLRWKGIRNFARSARLEIDPQNVVELPSLVDPSHGFETAQKLTEELIKRPRTFTALLAYDDVTALGAMQALSKAGIRVPEQCSVIGFDDVAPAAFGSPPLTTIRQPMQTMGATAVSMVTEAIKAAAESREMSVAQVKLAPEIVVRQSTRRIHG